MGIEYGPGQKWSAKEIEIMKRQIVEQVAQGLDGFPLNSFRLWFILNELSEDSIDSLHEALIDPDDTLHEVGEDLWFEGNGSR